MARMLCAAVDWAGNRCHRQIDDECLFCLHCLKRLPKPKQREAYCLRAGPRFALVVLERLRGVMASRDERQDRRAALAVARA